jgi:hypothetical protein
LVTASATIPSDIKHTIQEVKTSALMMKFSAALAASLVKRLSSQGSGKGLPFRIIFFEIEIQGPHHIKQVYAIYAEIARHVRNFRIV